MSWSLHVFWHMSKLISLRTFWQVLMQTLGQKPTWKGRRPQGGEPVGGAMGSGADGTKARCFGVCYSLPLSRVASLFVCLVFYVFLVFFFFLPPSAFIFAQSSSKHFATSIGRHITRPQWHAIDCRIHCSNSESSSGLSITELTRQDWFHFR